MTNEITAKEAIRWLDAIKKYYIHGGDEAYDKKRMKAIDMAIKALKLQPCEDCISRQAVDDAIYDYSRSCDVNYEQIMEFIDKLPSVTPERPKGKWIEDTQTGFKIRCSKCGARNFGADRAYCPRCGRQMKEDSDD